MLREKYSDPAQVDRAAQELSDYWTNKFSKLQVRTPDENMNTMLNIWNLYQSEINIMFSRFASFIEVGGRTGLGYRDTAQDAMTIPHSNPESADRGSNSFSMDWYPKGMAFISLIRLGLRSRRR